MIKPRIIVTGATGKTGNVAVAELRKAGYPRPHHSNKTLGNFVVGRVPGIRDSPENPYSDWRLKCRRKPSLGLILF